MENNDSIEVNYSFIFRLILPIATATVERTFSAMNIIKNRLHSRMGDQWMNDCLVTYIEKNIFKIINNEKIMLRFQGMKARRGQLNEIVIYIYIF
jgi:hypothetical protein